jgi:hypothetical protein
MWEPRRLTSLWAFTTCYRDIVYEPRSLSWYSYVLDMAWVQFPAGAREFSLRHNEQTFSGDYLASYTMKSIVWKIIRWLRGTFYPQKLTLTLPTSGGRSVGIVRLRTKATEFSFLDLNLFTSKQPLKALFWYVTLMKLFRKSTVRAILRCEMFNITLYDAYKFLSLNLK